MADVAYVALILGGFLVCALVLRALQASAPK
ncbi:hypothetical protein ABH922_002650 [Rhodococcus sp. 27YEA15]